MLFSFSRTLRRRHLPTRTRNKPSPPTSQIISHPPLKDLECKDFHSLFFPCSVINFSSSFFSKHRILFTPPKSLTMPSLVVGHESLGVGWYTACALSLPVLSLALLTFSQGWKGKIPSRSSPHPGTPQTSHFSVRSSSVMLRNSPSLSTS
jgi:hypothetical protein